MKKIIILISFSVSALFMGGCISTDIGAYRSGTEVTPMQTESFIVGETTTDQVLAKLGAPTNQTEVNSKIVWTYDFVMIRHIGKNVQESTVFEFNSENVLVRYYKGGKSATPTGNPLLDAANTRK